MSVGFRQTVDFPCVIPDHILQRDNTLALWLVVLAADRVCALPLNRIGEVMRPLPVRGVPGTPASVAGVARVRGVPTAIVDAGLLLGGRASTGAESRFVTIIGASPVALRVEAVFGVRELDAEALTLPPLIEDSPLVSAIGARDRDLLLILRTSRLIPHDVEALLAQQPRV